MNNSAKLNGNKEIADFIFAKERSDFRKLKARVWCYSRAMGNSTDEQFLNSGQGKMLIYSADTALVCGDSKAEYLVFEND